MSFLLIIVFAFISFMLGRYLNTVLNLIKGKRNRIKKKKEEIDFNNK